MSSVVYATYLCWFAYFSTDNLPLVGLVLFDRIEECLTLNKHQQRMLGCLRERKRDVPRLQQILHNAYPTDC